jgi:leucyl-tRNA synthetase
LTVEDRITMAVQVNGKTRGTISVSRDVTQEQAMDAALADPSIAKFVVGAPRKVIFVPGRMLNIVL